MKYSANPLLVEFRDSTVPGEWKSKQAKRIYDAAVEQESTGAWHEHVITGSIKLDIEPTEPFVSPFGTPEHQAEARTRRYIATERSRLDRMEQELSAFGGQHFTARREQVRAPNHPFDAEPFILALLSRHGVRAIWVHGVKFVRDASRAFVRAE